MNSSVSRKSRTISYNKQGAVFSYEGNEVFRSLKADRTLVECVLFKFPLNDLGCSDAKFRSRFSIKFTVGKLFKNCCKIYYLKGFIILERA